MVQEGETIEILLVEDNPGDVRLTQEALKESKLLNNLHVAIDGQEAMLFLKKEGDFADKPTPDIILLDLNLPIKDGPEVLEEIKADTVLRRIPVVIITSSEAEENILKTYEHYANCYIQKPLNLDQFSRVVQAISNFWFSIVKLPPKE